MSTRDLAKKLGLIETISFDDDVYSNYSVQPFKYLFVLDFEATCWDKNDIKHPNEIIEFSVALYSIESAKVVAEFQQYVMPIEQPRLSDFCTQLTGITQGQVNNGVPLGTCLMLFKQWVDEQSEQYNLSFEDEVGMNSCIYVTWSDWDLGTCLKKECNRKALIRPEMFRRWIDLRALYKDYYDRSPKGLIGALTDVGLTFQGTQHCGLHDAKNTAYLAGKMMADGVLLKVSKKSKK